MSVMEHLVSYYFFYEDVNATIPLDITDQIFYKGNSYTFERLSGVNNHPFYISDTPVNGSYYNGSLSFANTGGSSSAGIVSGGKIPLQFPQVHTQMNCTIIVLHIPPWLVLMDSK